MTWRDLASKISSVKTNLLVIDEFNSRFDADGKEFMINLLESIEDTTVFAIIPDNYGKMNGSFDKIQELKKDKNFSCLT